MRSVDEGLFSDPLNLSSYGSFLNLLLKGLWLRTMILLVSLGLIKLDWDRVRALPLDGCSESWDVLGLILDPPLTGDSRLIVRATTTPLDATVTIGLGSVTRAISDADLLEWSLTLMHLVEASTSDGRLGISVGCLVTRLVEGRAAIITPSKGPLIVLEATTRVASLRDSIRVITTVPIPIILEGLEISVWTLLNSSVIPESISIIKMTIIGRW
jgi:hypothetical protein